MSDDAINDHQMFGYTGKTRTDMFCHQCRSNFVAIVDYSLSGNHAIECPKCGHLHYRHVVDGKVTDKRYDSDYRDNNAHIAGVVRDMWKSETIPMVTQTTKHFLREKWLNLDQD